MTQWLARDLCTCHGNHLIALARGILYCNLLDLSSTTTNVWNKGIHTKRLHYIESSTQIPEDSPVGGTSTRCLWEQQLAAWSCWTIPRPAAPIGRWSQKGCISDHTFGHGRPLLHGVRLRLSCCAQVDGTLSHLPIHRSIFQALEAPVKSGPSTAPLLAMIAVLGLRATGALRDILERLGEVFLQFVFVWSLDLLM